MTDGRDRARHRPLPGRSAAALAREMSELKAAVTSLQATLGPLPDQLAKIARATDAQRRRVDALGEAQAKLQERLQRLDERLRNREHHRLRALLGSLRGLAARLRPNVSSLELPPAPPAPPVSWILLGGRATSGARAVLVVLFGLPPSDQEAVIARVLASAASGEPPVVPVFLTDDSDFTVLRRHRALFEYLPFPPADRPGAGPRDWPLYLARRFALLCAKWQPVQVVAFGPAAARQLALWRTSPHLPDAAKELLAVTRPAPRIGLPAEAQVSSKNSTAPSSRS